MLSSNRKDSSVKCLLVDQKYNQNLDRSKKQKSNINNLDVLHVDSPYQHALSKIKPIDQEKDDSDDFKTPPSVKKVSKLISKPISKVGKKKNLKKIKQNLILKTTKESFGELDVHPESLQVALALSKSTNELNSPYQNIDGASVYSSDANTGIVEKYGFKPSKSNPNVQKHIHTNAASFTNQKKRKNMKFRYVTPVLLTRTDEDREALITTKISFILRHIENQSSNYVIQPPVEIFSKQIKRYHNKENRIIQLNVVDNENLLKEVYLVKNLDLPINKYCCGCLLRKWEDIPGRVSSSNDLSKSDLGIKVDERFVTSENSSGEGAKSRGLSPDLFESDDDLSFHENETNVLNSSPSLGHPQKMVLSKVFKSDLGIEHFESDFEDSLIVSKQINKLMKNESMSGENWITYSDDDNIVLNESNYNDKNEDSAKNSNKKTKSDSSLIIDYFQTEDIDSCVSVSPSSLDNTTLKNNSEGIEINEATNSELESPDKEIVLKTDSVNATFDRKENSLNNTENLNVTDYVNAILNSENSVLNDVQLKTPVVSIETLHSDDFTSLNERNIAQENSMLSDDELNYSSMKSEKIKSKQFYNVSSSDEDEIKEIVCDSTKNIVDVLTGLKEIYSQDAVARETTSEENILGENFHDRMYPTQKLNLEVKVTSTNNDFSMNIINTCKMSMSNTSASIKDTPKSSMFIKTKNITPMANYEEMDSPQIKVELDKFGLKPLKRRRGIQLLKYMYESTHPVVEIESTTPDESTRISKKHKTYDEHTYKLYPNQNLVVNVLGNSLIQNENEELIFEKKKSKKIVSCAVPLQIIWYNFLSCNPEVHKSILLYEPLHLEVIHSMLREQSGCQFKIEDVQKFLDGKCITFRTSQYRNRNGSNQK